MHLMTPLFRRLGLSAAPLALVALAAGSAQAQISFTGATYTQSFDGIGTTATAALPTGFKADKSTTAQSVGTFAAAVTATERLGGASLATNAANGIYNFGSGATTTGSDRSVGFLSSSTATKSGNLYAQITNNTGAPLTSLVVSYDVEKYRNGTNAAGYSVQLYSSTTDAAASYTSAGATFLTSFAADANNNGFNPAPGTTVPVTGTLTFGAPVANGGTVYLAFNYSVTNTATTTFAQALAIDNVQLAAVPDVGLAVELTSWSAKSQASAVTLTWSTASERDHQGFFVERRVQGSGTFSQIASYGTDATLRSHDVAASYRITDRAVRPGVTYEYQLADVSRSGVITRHGVRTVTVEAAVESTPTVFGLEQNSPNPFNPTTSIGYQLPVAGQVTLAVFNALGQQIRTLVAGNQTAGAHEVAFDGVGLSSGLYLYRLELTAADGSISVQTRRMLLVR